MRGTVIRRVAAGAVATLATATAFACAPSPPTGPRPSTEMLPFEDPDLALEVRVDDLLSRMTLREKVSQMTHEAAAVERLGIHAYDWWSEALHGVARAARGAPSAGKDRERWDARYTSSASA